MWSCRDHICETPALAAPAISGNAAPPCPAYHADVIILVELSLAGGGGDVGVETNAPPPAATFSASNSLIAPCTSVEATLPAGTLAMSAAVAPPPPVAAEIASSTY